MGAWGPGVFENDLAADWVAMFHEDGTPGYLPYTFEDIDNDPDYVDEVVSSFVLAAAEVVAAVGGRPAGAQWIQFPGGPHLSGPPPSIAEWIRQSKFKPDGDLVELARSCVTRVLSNSELKDEWEASDSFQAWQQSLVDLNRRLESIQA
jgi:hypothetical protein